MSGYFLGCISSRNFLLARRQDIKYPLKAVYQLTEASTEAVIRIFPSARIPKVVNYVSGSDVAEILVCFVKAFQQVIDLFRGEERQVRYILVAANHGSIRRSASSISGVDTAKLKRMKR